MTTRKLTILATSDTHGMLVPYDYILNQEDHSGSLAQVSTFLKEQYHAEDTILIDAGDVIQGNHAELFQNEPIHPMVQAMNDVPYEIHVIGNHDIDFGMDALQNMIHSMKGTMLTGNLYSKDGSPLASGYQILVKNGIRVAFIGMTTPLIKLWTEKQLAGCTVTSAIDETRRIIDTIQGKYDLLIGIYHMGIENELRTPGTGVRDLANACPEFDLLISSHAHNVIEELYLNNILTVQNGSKAVSVIRIDFELEETNTGYQCISKTSRAIRMEAYEPDLSVLKKYEPYHQRQLEDLNRIIGVLEGGPLSPENELPWYPQPMLQPTALMTLINKVMLYYSGAKVSAAPFLAAGASLYPGPIHKYDLCKIFKHNNSLSLIELNGRQLKLYLEWSSQFYPQWKPGDLSLYSEGVHPISSCDQFYGIHYIIDCSKPAGSRIIDLTWPDGSPVRENETFALCTTSFRMESVLTRPGEIYDADDLPRLLVAEVHNELGTIRELIGHYIQDVLHGVLTPECEVNWKLIGTNWDESMHEKAVELVRQGILKPEQFIVSRKQSLPITEDDIKPYLND